MEIKEDWERADKKEIGKRLKLSDKKAWNGLKIEEQEAVINKYYNLRGIEYLGIDKILEDNRNLRFNYALLVIGVLLGIFGNIFADILMQFEPKNYYIDTFILIIIGIFLWRLIRKIDKMGAEHLYQEDVLGYLLELIKRDQKEESTSSHA